MSKILVPVRYSAWLDGDLGRMLMTILETGLVELPGQRVTRLPRGFLVEYEESSGPALELVARATRLLDEYVAAHYPVFHHEMGPVWTGTLLVVYAAGEDS
jgi:hypothetical protein